MTVIFIPVRVVYRLHMEFYDEAQKRFEYFENNVTNFLGIQDNEYYYIGGTLTGAYNTIKGASQFAGGALIGARGMRDTTIGIKGILSGDGTISLMLTVAGVGELMLAAEVSAGGVLKARSGFDSFNRNYEKFAKMTEGTGGTKIVNGFEAKVNVGQQEKHIPGTNNYKNEIANGKVKSTINGDVNDVQRLLDEKAGTGTMIGNNKERVDFGEIIGQYVDPNTGIATDTTVGIIHYGKKGAHIVPARPK